MSERVSTTCGSGWVIVANYRSRLRELTHPPPQVVLTPSSQPHAGIRVLLARLFEKIFSTRVARRIQDLIGIAKLDDFAAFHVEQSIREPFEERHRV